MKRVRIKICGLCSGADAMAAAEAGADAIGLVFYPDSSRHVTPEQAVAISAQLPPFITRVALFLDASAAEVSTTCARLRPDLLQFHGRETPRFCRSFGVPYVKAVPMADGAVDLSQWAADFHDARALLLDAHSPGQAGGGGQAFDWQGSTALASMPVIVAGGLAADNVGAAIDRFRPYAVDVSSGVESAPGVKDVARMNEFYNAVSRHCCG